MTSDWPGETPPPPPGGAAPSSGAMHPPPSTGAPQFNAPPPPPPGGPSLTDAVMALPERPTIDVPDPIVRTTGLTKMYGSLAAVNSVDLAVPRGSIYGLIGPNGAGKTTLMTMIASLLRPTAGEAWVDGYSSIDNSADVRRLTGYMPDGLGVYEGLDVGGYLEFFAAAYKIPRDQWAELIEGLLELVALDVKRDAQVNSLSRGMKQRLSLARSLVHDPKLLILDEPASGLDPRARIELRELLWALQGMGKSIIVSSHILSELQEICTHVGIVEAGQMLAEGSPESITSKLGATRRVRVRFDDGSVEDFEVADQAGQVELLRSLVNSGERSVLEFREVSSGLEDVFMNVTQGIVQ